MKILSSHPHWPHVLEIYRTLTSAGYRTLLAGGCVRDGLLGIIPNDFDIATSATPEQVESLFERTEAVGKQFGIIMVIFDSIGFEVATFRRDGNYQDGRRPLNVEFCDEKEDAIRRDFTVNALFYDIEKKQTVDYVGGVQDLQDQTLRAVGDPNLRFEEDHLRLLRTVRFSAQLAFQIEAETFRAVRKNAAKVTKVAIERLQSEMDKMFSSRNPIMGIEQMIEAGLWECFFKPVTLPPSEHPQWDRLQWWLWVVLLSDTDDFFGHWRHSKADQKWLRGQGKRVRQLSLANDELVLSGLDEAAYQVMSTSFFAKTIEEVKIPAASYRWARECRKHPLLTGSKIARFVSGAMISDLESRALRAQIRKEIYDTDSALSWIKEQSTKKIKT